MENLANVIKKSVMRLGYAKLKREQEDVVTAFLSGRDVFLILPTGFGKTLCYACLPLILMRGIKSSCTTFNNGSGYRAPSYITTNNRRRLQLYNNQSTRFAYSTRYIYHIIGCVICGILTVIYDKYL